MQSQLGDYFAQMLADPAYIPIFQAKSVIADQRRFYEQQAGSLGLRISDSASIWRFLSTRFNWIKLSEFKQLRRAGFSATSLNTCVVINAQPSSRAGALQGSEFVRGESTPRQLIAQTRDIPAR
ncbi:hypothetical protein OH492_20795 [Vibrio chagasii]|nr:hypothetical protein [Vibrio chagasii]